VGCESNIWFERQNRPHVHFLIASAISNIALIITSGWSYIMEWLLLGTEMNSLFVDKLVNFFWESVHWFLRLFASCSENPNSVACNSTSIGVITVNGLSPRCLVFLSDFSEAFIS